MSTPYQYPAADWFAELIFSLGRYRDVIAFLHDEDAILAHTPSGLCFSDAHPNGEQMKTGALVNLLRQSKAKSFMEMANFVSRQQIVFQVTLCEVFTKELFTRAFKAQPERMLPYLSSDDKQPTIRVKRLFSSPNLDILLGELVQQAALRASDCPPPKLVDRIIKLGGAVPTPDLRAAYESLVLLRNDLVHENFQREVTQAMVESGFDTCENFLKFCESAALALDIPVDKRHWSEE